MRVKRQLAMVFYSLISQLPGWYATSLVAVVLYSVQRARPHRVVVQIAFLLAVELTLVYYTLLFYPMVLRYLFVVEQGDFLASFLGDFEWSLYQA